MQKREYNAKTYLITGATSGIGNVCTNRLLEQGNKCILVARNQQKLNAITDMYPKSALTIPTDLTDYNSINNFIRNLSKETKFDGIIYCAGIAPLKKIEENEPDVVYETYMVNVFAFIDIIKQLFNINLISDNASIVAISSVTAHKGSNRQSIYAGTKAALEATIRCMAREFISKNTKIRVNAVCPGTVETDMLKNLRKQSPNLDDKLMVSHPLGIINPENVCHMIEYLLSDKSINITGTSIRLDSGFLL